MSTSEIYDVLIIGGGPAGLCAAINGASEGLKVAILDAQAQLGGQAKESSAIENYPLPLEFVDGVTGEDLTQGFIAQARKFEAAIFCPARAARIEMRDDVKVITTDDFHEYAAHCVILSMGLSYRRLDAFNISKFMGRGVYYGVPGHLRKMKGKHVAVVGGANSAGQAAVKLAQTAEVVWLLARSPLVKSMSTYLIDRIHSTENIRVIDTAEVESCSGGKTLQAITLKNKSESIPLDCMFIYIGAVPHTAWLMGSGVMLNSHRFILTDVDVTDRPDVTPLLPCETSMHGVFAAGDVRFGQGVKRITGAIGDGIQALQSCHRFCSAVKGGR